MPEQPRPEPGAGAPAPRRRLRAKPASYQWLYAPRMADRTPRRLVAIYDRRGRILELHDSASAIKCLLWQDRYNNMGRLPTVYITVDEYNRWLEENDPTPRKPAPKRISRDARKTPDSNSLNHPVSA